MKTAAEIRDWLNEQIAAILGVSADEIDPDETFDSFGLASRDAVSLSGDLEDYLGRRLSPVLLYQYPTIRGLADYLAGTEVPAHSVDPEHQAAQVKAETAAASAARAHKFHPSQHAKPSREQLGALVPSKLGEPAHEPVAVIGLACRMPGADSTAEYWQLLAEGRDAISEVPDARWDREGLYDPHVGASGKMSTKWGGFLSDLAHWDAHFFGVSPREASRMDPQQRFLLEAAWGVLEHAGIPADGLAGSNTGVFIGVSANDYSRLQTGVPEHADAYMGTGNAFSVAANRISYLFDFRGPSMAVDTACSSSLVSVHLACNSLASGECDLALAGGVNVILTPEITISFSQAHMMAADGRCKTFDASADGYVRGEGVGMVALKRLSDAERDGDRILAVIRGSAVNQDGRSNGLTAPNPEAQRAVITQALANAGVLPSQVSYIEAHGTGTSLGDPIEVRGLTEALSPGRPDGLKAAIASAKTNIGHLESAAGIASLVKVVLMMEHRQIPPSVHFKKPNPLIAFDSAPLAVQTALGPWEPVGELPRIAGISAFGFGGTNAHLIVVEHQQKQETPCASPVADRPYLLNISARSATALRHQAQTWLDFLSATDACPEDIAYSASALRTHHEYRLSMAGSSVEEWRKHLSEFLAGETGTGLCCDQPTPNKAHRVAVVFSGQGTQWAGMGQGLLRHEPAFRAEVEAIDAAWAPLAGWSIIDALQSADRLDQTEVAQPAIFAIQAGITALLRSWGLPIEGATGHSVGEIAAAYTGGVLTLADTIRVLYHRSRLMQAATGLGKMAAVGVSESQARELIKGYEDKLSIAAINSPRMVTLSGDASALGAITSEGQARGLFCRMLQVNYAFHSPQMEPFLEELRAAVDGIQTQPAKMVVVSTVTGRVATSTDFDKDYWPRNVRQTVRFADAIGLLANEGFDAFIEVSPHGGMVQSIAECLPDGNECRVVGSLQRGKPERASLLAAVAQLYTCGIAPTSATQASTAKRVDIPHYTWDRQHYWSQVPTDRGLAPASVAAGRQEVAGAARPQVHPLLGHRVSSPALESTVYEQVLSTRSQSYLADHRITGAGTQPVPVLPAAAYLEMLLAAGAATTTDGSMVVESVDIARALPLGVHGRTVQVILSGQEAKVFSEGEGAEWVLHASANLRAEAPAAATPAPSLDELRQRCAAEMDVSEFYRELATHGLHYGPAFRGVDGLWRGDSEAYGRIVLPPAIKTEGHLLHPALLDACFHLVAAALPPERNKGEEFVYLPVTVERLSMTSERRAERSAYASARIRDNGAPSGGQPGDVIADLTIITESGEPIAWVTGLCVRPVHRKLLALMVGAGEERAAHEEAPEAASQSEPAQPPERVEDWIYEVGWQETEPLSPAGPWAKGLWLLLADEQGTAAGLAGALKSGGGSVWLARQAQATDAENNGEPEPGATEASLEWLDDGLCRLDGRSPDAIRELVAKAVAAGEPVRGAAYLWGLDAEPGDAGQGLQGLLNLTQVLARTPAASSPNAPRLWIVTRGGVAISESEGCSPEQAALWGFGNVAALEHPELKPVRLDLDSGVAAEALVSELSGAGHEDRVALRGTKRLVARLRRSQLPQARAGAAVSTADGGSPRRLEITERGMLDNMVRVPMARVEPGPGQVEIRVRAAGLNFRDVMNVLGLYPGDAGLLGGECAGVVVKTGPGVEGLHAGDRVMGIAPGCFGAYTTTHADLVTRIPGNLDFEQAATIPIAFLTAHYALDRLGKMTAGDRVLVHAASGGVGLAAIQLAQLAGAEVFATAGSPAKREFLQSLGLTHVMNSRNLAFSDETLAQTGGRGVDLVLNSLADQFIPKSLAALAPNGRFLEIGKVGIWDAEQVRQVRPEASYYTIALDDLSARQPEIIASLLAELVPHFEAGRLKPLPSTVYPIEKASDGFRLMAQTRHIGKIVISQEAEARAAEGNGPARGLSEKATYLITGGTGALGTLVARRLVDLGARHLVLAGVTQPSEAGSQAITEIEAAGTEVKVVVSDVSQASAASELISSLRNAGSPPLRGIIHAAGLLDDGVILQQSWQRFERVLAPKVAGGWNLHTLTANEPLDFFILFSSVASLLGSPGQANYASANGFMDGLAALRQSTGLAGLSINWGPWAVGMAAAGDERDRKRREASGIAAIAPEKGLEVLERLITGGVKGERAIAPMIWETFAAQFAPGEEPALLKDLIGDVRKRRPNLGAKPAASPVAGDGKTDLVKRLEAAPARDRMGIMVGFIRERTLKVLALDPGYQLDTRKPMNEMGLDSLMAIELKNALDAGIGRKLPTTLVFEHPTIEAMAKHLLEGVLGLSTKAEAITPENKVEAPIREAAGAAGAEQPASQAALSEEAVAAMSEEEAEAALLQKLLELDE